MYIEWERSEMLMVKCSQKYKIKLFKHCLKKVHKSTNENDNLYNKYKIFIWIDSSVCSFSIEIMSIKLRLSLGKNIKKFNPSYRAFHWITHAAMCMTSYKYICPQHKACKFQIEKQLLFIKSLSPVKKLRITTGLYCRNMTEGLAFFYPVLEVTAMKSSFHKLFEVQS